MCDARISWRYGEAAGQGACATRLKDRAADGALRGREDDHPLGRRRASAPAGDRRRAWPACGRVVGLLTPRQWRAGDVAALQPVAERLGLTVVPPDIDRSG